MNRPRTSTVIGIAVTVVVGFSVVVLVRELYGCTPPDEQADMIERFEADPLIATSPHDGRLVAEHAHTRDCDSVLATGGSPTGPGFAEVMRLYTTPTADSRDQLRQRFDEPAAAGGWRLEADPTGHLSDGMVRYCKEAAGRAVHARVSSTSYSAAPAVRVRLSAGSDGSKCNVDPGGR